MELSDQDKHLLLDYCLGIAPQDQVVYIEGLISTNPQAKKVHASFKNALLPLEAIQAESCPDDLVEKTVARLKDATGQKDLRRLLDAEKDHPNTIRMDARRNVAQIAAIAAIVVFAVGITIPSLRFTRGLYLRHRCQSQLSRIYDGLSSYITDHDGKMPSVAMADGSPWWKVGYQGRENHSNTRPVWLLVRHGYVDPVRFVCPGTRQRGNLGEMTVADYNDFPARENLSYSFRLCCDKTTKNPNGRVVLMADMNPLSERLPRDFSRPFKLKLDQSVLTSNSLNHRRSGQNILMCDGTVPFARTRLSGISQDDVFSLRTMTSGSELTGCEMPSCETDAFLAP